MAKTATKKRTLPAFPGLDVTGEAFASGLLAMFEYDRSDAPGMLADNGLAVAGMVEAHGRLDEAIAAVEARIDTLCVKRERGTLTDREYAEYDKAGRFLTDLDVVLSTPYGVGYGGDCAERGA